MNKCPSIFYSWPNWGRRKAFVEWTRIDLASKPSLTFGGNVNYYKCLSSYSYSACGNREHRGNIRGNIRSPFNWVSRYILLLTKLKRELKFGKNVKETQRYYPFTHMYHIWSMMYGSWDIRPNGQSFFVILGHFWLFYPPNNSKTKIMKIWRKKMHIDIMMNKITRSLMDISNKIKRCKIWLKS